MGRMPPTPAPISRANGMTTKMRGTAVRGTHQTQRAPIYSLLPPHMPHLIARAHSTDSAEGPVKAQGGAASTSQETKDLEGATVVRQPGDGSCLFHSLSHGMRLLEGAGSELDTADAARDVVVRFIEKHSDAECAGSPLRDWIDWESGLDPVAYCARMRQAGEWGGAIELLVFSRIACVNVLVYERDPSKPRRFRLISSFETDPNSCERARKPVRLLYSGRCHYDALQSPA
mmetsp:Transcript_35826/g.94110  ORF Transcript_35826/g.94110 Transcript_35826/m.94110 type:complete len:231 (-) Transcript_35826:325-1017(-)